MDAAPAPHGLLATLDAVAAHEGVCRLKQHGLDLLAVAEVLQGQRDPAAALGSHLKLLELERQRIGRQIESVKTTLRKIERGEQVMAEEAFDGFDHTQRVMQKPPAGIPRPASAQVRGPLAILIAGSA